MLSYDYTNKGGDQMTAVGLNIKARREELGLTQEELAKRLNYKSKSTINKIEMGINDITQSKVIAFAKALETTPANLMGWEDDSLPLTKKDREDIREILEATREKLVSQEGLMFDGDPASPEAIDSIINAMEIGMEMAKKKNKEKYTPKKYKKD